MSGYGTLQAIKQPMCSRPQGLEHILVLMHCTRILTLVLLGLPFK